MNWKSFVIGFLAGVALFSAIGQWRVRPQNVIASWPDDDNKKGMEMMSPWITNARVAKLGAFTVFVPSDQQKAEAILHPMKNGFPKVIINSDTTPSISFMDSKNRMISVRFNEATGEFTSYDYSPSFIGGISYVDSNLDGAYDLRIGPGSSLAVNHKDNWQPVVRKDKKRYIEVDGVLREIEMKDFTWSFLHPQ
jgi:hypothetical protein